MQHYVYDVSHALTQGIRIRKLKKQLPLIALSLNTNRTFGIF
jgi:hypothetical protein